MIAAPAMDRTEAAQAFALVAVGDLEIGVPSACVTQALPWPAELTRLPRLQGALEGVFVHRGQVVPLVNLRQWMALPPEPSAAQQVLILGVAGRVLGVAVDAVCGLVQVAGSSVHRVHQDEAPEELFHSVATVEGRSSAISLLDPDRLMQQVQVWAGATTGPSSTSSISGNGSTRISANTNTNEGAQIAPAVAANDAGRVGPTGMPAAHAVVRTGSITLACPAADVAEVLAMPLLQRVYGSDASLSGIARWRDRDVPVANILLLLGLGGPEGELSPWLLVLGHEDRYIGIPVDEIRSVQTFAANEVQTTDGAGLARPDLYDGLVQSGPNEPLALLNSRAIIDRCPLNDISRAPGLQGGSAGRNSRPAPATGGTAQAHMVFKAGHTFAIAIDGLKEIMPFPQSCVPHADANPALRGSFTWRGQSIALWDLQALMGLGCMTPDDHTRVIVLQLDEAVVGLAIEALAALLPAHQGVHSRFKLANTTDIHMISVGQGEAQRSYRVLSLAMLHASIHGMV